MLLIDQGKFLTEFCHNYCKKNIYFIHIPHTRNYNYVERSEAVKTNDMPTYLISLKKL